MDCCDIDFLKCEYKIVLKSSICQMPKREQNYI